VIGPAALAVTAALALTLTALEARLTAVLDRLGAPGVALVVVHRGRVVPAG
jgi:hypothetical protein